VAQDPLSGLQPIRFGRAVYGDLAATEPKNHLPADNQGLLHAMLIRAANLLP
jgi:hypothetical protein